MSWELSRWARLPQDPLLSQWAWAKSPGVDSWVLIYAQGMLIWNSQLWRWACLSQLEQIWARRNFCMLITWTKKKTVIWKDACKWLFFEQLWKAFHAHLHVSSCFGPCVYYHLGAPWLALCVLLSSLGLPASGFGPGAAPSHSGSGHSPTLEVFVGTITNFQTKYSKKDSNQSSQP